MNGWKLGFGLGVLVIACAVGALVLIDRSHAPTKTDGKELIPTVDTDDAPTPTTPPKLADLQRSFGGVTVTTAGGIAGVNDSVRIDPQRRVTVATRTTSRTTILDPRTFETLLRHLSEIAKDPTPPVAEDPPIADGLSTTMQLTWDGQQIEDDLSSTPGGAVLELVSDLQNPTTS